MELHVDDPSSTLLQTAISATKWSIKRLDDAINASSRNIYVLPLAWLH
jgi:hypothetical protein